MFRMKFASLFSSFAFNMPDLKASTDGVNLKKDFPSLMRPAEQFNISAPYPFSTPANDDATPNSSEPTLSNIMMSAFLELSTSMEIVETEAAVAQKSELLQVDEGVTSSSPSASQMLERRLEEQQKAFGRCRRNLMTKHEEKVQSLTYEVSELATQVKTLNVECDHLKSEKCRIEDMMYAEIEHVYDEHEGTRDEEIEALKAEIIELKEKSNLAKGCDVSELVAEVNTLRNECSRLEKDNQRIKEMMYSEIEQVYLDFEEERDEEKETRDKKISELVAQVNALRNECSRLEKDNQRIKEMMYSEIEQVYLDFEKERDED